MSILSRLKAWKVTRRKQVETVQGSATTPPLREFVYLDEVSLRSLLASQTGALTTEITNLINRADEAEIAGSISAGTTFMPGVNAEVSSRYQTTNSQGSQTSRKAIVQSLFKEFRELPSVNLAIEPSLVSERHQSVETLVAKQAGLAVSSVDLRRGVLVEIEVELVADPIFRFSTIISELGDMSDEYPEMLGSESTSGIMAQARPINRVLQRMLAGLIPLKARAVNLVVIKAEGAEYVVDRHALEGLEIESDPLYIVGVTEHLSYWRDVRRVLFGGAKFTVLGRVARDGLHDSWVAVKLAEVLAEIAPEFPAAIDAVGKVGYAAPVDVAEVRQQTALLNALQLFVAGGAEKTGFAIDDEKAIKYAGISQSLIGNATTAGGQREAFRVIAAELSKDAAAELTPDEWLELRVRARADAKLDLFRGPSKLSQYSTKPPKEAAEVAEQNSELLLDTEIIAIYW
jgi:hypothetical protein